MQSMTPNEIHAFIREGSRTGKLATVRKDGRPHCVPVWCWFDDSGILFTTMNNTIKAKNIRRDNRVSLVFENESFPYDFVAIEGNAKVLDVTLEEKLEISINIASRYVPEGREEEFGKRNAVSDELVIRVAATKIISAKGVAG
jgi:PPOX class probable F420-dependent enzyme